MLKKRIALLLIPLLLLALCACGQTESSEFRILSVIGTKRCSLLCRSGDRIAPVVNAAMEVLAADGTLDAVSARWLGERRCCLTGDAGALTALGELPEPRKLIFGVEGLYPTCSGDGDELTGMSVEIAEAIGALLGWEVQILKISAADAAAQLSSGNVDCALGFDPGLVSAEKYDVGVCYLESDVVLAVRPDSEVRRFRDLKGSRIGIVNDASVRRMVKDFDKITRYADGATEYLSSVRCISALDSGWCAAVAMDSLQLTYYRYN